MYVAAAAFVFGALLGWRRAKKFGGNTADKVQYAVAHAIAFSLITLVLLVLVAWLGIV